MEENKNFWNKTAAELTVKDQFVVTLAVPIVMVAGMVVTGAALTTWSAATNKFKEFRANRKNDDTVV